MAPVVNRQDSRAFAFFLNRGKPTRAPPREPVRDSCRFLSAAAFAGPVL
jgi:hypothetical protein